MVDDELVERPVAEWTGITRHIQLNRDIKP